MNNESYKDTTTTRGFKYHYYRAPARDSKPTLVLVHGFPSTSKDWRRIVPALEKEGYGLIVPDMLGYGGTDKPTDPSAYKPSLLAKDVVDVLDKEGVQKAIAVGHDWGAGIVSRLATVAPERFLAYAFLAVPYVPPNPNPNFEQRLAMTKEKFGYELFGYWLFFAQDDAPKIVKENWDTFFGLIFPQDPEIYKRIAPTGGLKNELLAGQRLPLPSWLTEEDKKEMSEALLQGGLAGPCCYYKVALNPEGDELSLSNGRILPPATSPIFYGAALKDYVCLAAVGKMVFGGEGFKEHNVTIKEYDAGHWLILSNADEISRDLIAWAEGVAASSASHL